MARTTSLFIIQANSEVESTPGDALSPAEEAALMERFGDATRAFQLLIRTARSRGLKPGSRNLLADCQKAIEAAGVLGADPDPREPEVEALIADLERLNRLILERML